MNLHLFDKDQIYCNNMLLACDHSEGEWQSSEEEDQKQYQCFCDKLYPSQSAVYLHLKYKHTMIFNKNQTDNLRQRFSKGGKIGNKRIYRLNLPSDDNSVEMVDREQKNNDKIRKSNNQFVICNDIAWVQLNKRKSCPELQRNDRIKRNCNEDDYYPFDYQTYNRPKQPIYPQIIEIIDADQHDNQIEKKDIHSNKKVTKQHTLTQSPFILPYQCIASIHNIKTPTVDQFPFYPIEFTPSFRQVLEQCLSEIQNIHPQSGEIYRQILYGLMTYIDTNHPKINDQRVTQKIILSYCSTFSGELIGPLIKQYTLQSPHKDNTHLNTILKWLNNKGFKI